MAKELTETQKMKIENIAGFDLLTLIAEDDKVAEFARKDSETLARIFLKGCQAGCTATFVTLRDEFNDRF